MKTIFNSHGLTLPEVLIVLALLGIFTGLTVPYARGLIHTNRLKTATRDLANECERLALESTAQAETVKLVVEKSQYRVEFASGSRAGKVVRFTDFKAPISAVLRETPTRSVFFYPSGTTSPTTIELTEGRSTCRIIVSLRGRVHYLCTR